MATIKNLVLEQGATFSANIQYLDKNKIPIPLVGYNVRSKMRKSYDAANAAAFVAVITNDTTGNINLSLTASETAALEYGRYVYDVEAYSGQVLVRVVEGTIDVTPGVSGMDLGSLLSGNVSTSDLIEGNNLYFTNARVASLLTNYQNNIIPIVSNTYDLGSPTNRWKSLYLEATTINLGNVAISLNELTGNITFTDTSPANTPVSLLASSIQLGTGANAVVLGANTGTLQTLLSPNSITSVELADGAVTLSKIEGLNTANVPELVNLYFTNARAITAFTAGSNISIDANGVISASGQITGTNLTGYATNSNLALKANITDLTTANIAEVTNLYFTNARARAVFTAGSNITIDANGIISSTGGSGGGLGSVTQANLTTANVVEFTNLYFTNARARLAFTAGANITIDANGIISSTGGGGGVGSSSVTQANLTTSNVVELTNLYYTNARVYSNIISILPAYATVANLNLRANLTQLTTANVSEITNLYYTNTRVYANISPLLTTANVSEVTNLYYTNARVYSNVIPLLNLKANIIDLTTANVSEITNLYYTNARVYSNVISLFANYATIANLNLKANIADLTTANIAELTNLYYTNARVYSNVIGLLGNYATVSNLNLKANIADLTTSNITEGNNLYYTNARVYSNVIGLLNNYATVSNLNLKANLTQLTTANVTESTSNLYFTNSRVYSNVTTLLPTYAGNVGAANVNVGTGVGGAIVGANLISANNFVADTITANTISLSYRPAFRVWGNGSTNIVTGTTLDSGNVTLDYNQNSAYNTSTGVFTAPITGLYQIFLNVRAGSTNGLSQIAVLKNNQNSAGNILCFWEIITNNASATHFGSSTVARLTANDNVRAKVLAGSVNFDSNDNWGVAFIG